MKQNVLMQQCISRVLHGLVPLINMQENYIFKDFVKTIEATSLKFCMILKLRTLHPEKTTAQVKFGNCSNAHAQTFVLLNGEMAIVSTCFRKLKFWLWLLWAIFFLMQTGFVKIGLNKLS